MPTPPPPVEWRHSPGLTPYPEALAQMEERVDAIIRGEAPEQIWLLEHPPLYTAGTSAKPGDLLSAQLPVFATGRGGQYTYHGPGQRVAYAMLDLKHRFAPMPPDLRRYVQQLEQWIIDTLAEFGVEGFVREGRVGVWVEQKSEIRNQKSENPLPTSDFRLPISDFREAKIAALGVRVRRGVAFHGLCLNVSPDLSHYAGIVPCGLRDYGVTSLEELGVGASMAEVDAALQKQCPFL